MIQKLKETAHGWLNYFRMASIQGKLKELDGWLRNRLRYCIGKPLYTRTPEISHYSDMRGAPRQLITGEAVYSIIARFYSFLLINSKQFFFFASD
jgi:hypothetical protein